MSDNTPKWTVGIDPGSDRSAWAIWSGQKFEAHGIAPNERMVEELTAALYLSAANQTDRPERVALVIEQVCCYGRPVGAEVFRTVWWSGIFQVRLGCSWPVCYATKPQLCRWWLGRPGGTDAMIRAALIERYGQPGRSRKVPEGILWGIRADEWLAAALAIALHEGIETSPGY